jgi:hypothetical protein
MRQRLKPYRIVIETLWGQGYRLSPSDRHRAMDMILRTHQPGQPGIFMGPVSRLGTSCPEEEKS